MEVLEKQVPAGYVGYPRTVGCWRHMLCGTQGEIVSIGGCVNGMERKGYGGADCLCMGNRGSYICSKSVVVIRVKQCDWQNDVISMSRLSQGEKLLLLLEPIEILRSIELVLLVEARGRVLKSSSFCNCSARAHNF